MPPLPLQLLMALCQIQSLHVILLALLAIALHSPAMLDVCLVIAMFVLLKPSWLDDDSSPAPTEDIAVCKLNGECIAGCGKDHDAYDCPNLAGDREHQKKIIASLSNRCKFLPVWAITVTDDDDDDVNLSI